MENSFDVQKMIDSIADHMWVEDGIRRAYCVVCNPAIYIKVDSLLNSESRSPYDIDGRVAVALHEWCPLETVFFPKDKAEYDKLEADLDRVGEKMTGKICVEPGCDLPVDVPFGVGKPGLCQQHADDLDRKATWTFCA